MAQITLITVGSLKEKYLTDAANEYKKRLSLFAKFDELELKEEKISNEDDRAEIARALDREAERILAAMPRDAMKIALCVEGREYTSEELAALVGRGVDTAGKICLVIGSSHGLAERVKAACDVRLSFSRLTFPHQLMRVVLLEALYRSFTILAGKKYHK